MIFESLWLKFLAAGVATLVGIAATYYFKMKPDNPIEQAAEMVIKQETGMDIDLSPTKDIPDKLNT